MPDLPDVAAFDAHQMGVATSAMEMASNTKPDPEAWAERIAASVRAEREGVRDFLAAQEERLERAEAAVLELLNHCEETGSFAASGSGDDEEDYQRRYEMALEDLRDLKASNALLQDQLAKARAAASALNKQPQTPETKLDWESQKRRLLAALESDFDESNPEQQADRLKIEDVIRTTDNVIAEKDEQIQQLTRQLEESSNGAGAVAVAAAALAEALDTDTAVRQERERLQQLQEQMKNKMCQAEIELSLERAKLARDRVHLEEQMRSVQTDTAKAPGAADATEPTRGRWLSRLGLTEADRERGRHS